MSERVTEASQCRNLNIPTTAMVSFAKQLLSELGYDLDDYDFDQMSYSEVSDLINELKDERGF